VRQAPWIIGGLCAAAVLLVGVVLIIAAIWYVALRQSPESSLEDRFAAWEAEDRERYEELSIENFRGETYTCEDWQTLPEEQLVQGIVFDDRILSTTVAGDRATVRAWRSSSVTPP
jgi:hypothetical protein